MADTTNIIERANKVLTFRKYIREECRKKGLEYPSDEKVAEWITQEYGWSVEDFMKDYTEKQGIFRDPFEDFKAAILAMEWVTPPSEDEMRSYVAGNGYNVKGFTRYHTINGYGKVEKAVLLSVMENTIHTLRSLWNEFIEESAMYGEDSYIYDLQDTQDIQFLKVHMKDNELIRMQSIKNKGIRYLQWLNLHDNKLIGRSEEDIKDTIVAYWGEIFERILAFPKCYHYIMPNDDFVDEVILPALIKELGYEYDYSQMEMKKSC